jgi:hypothetical protein
MIADCRLKKVSCPQSQAGKLDAVDIRLPIDVSSLQPPSSVKVLTGTDAFKPKIVNRQSSILPVAAATPTATTTAASAAGMSTPGATATTAASGATSSPASAKVVARRTRFVDG